MLYVDLAILFGVAVVTALGAGALASRFGRRLEERRRQRIGARNAAEERRRLDERCAVCGEPVDPSVDLYERAQWWHRRCWRGAVDA